MSHDRDTLGGSPMRSEEHGHGHGHGITTDADTRYLKIALGLIGGFMLVEVVVAALARSLALFSDAGHMLSDSGAIAAALWAIKLAARPASGPWTFGLKRAEILSAAANGITLLVVSGIVTFEAIRRLIDPPNVEGGAVIAVGLFGVIINIMAAAALAKANRSSLNVEAAYQHVLTDLYGFIATVVAAAVVITTGFNRADSIASLIVVALMLRAAYGLLRESGRVLLEAAPTGIDLGEIRDHLDGIDHVLGVHDLHVWTVTSNLPTLSAHVVVEDQCFRDDHHPAAPPRRDAGLPEKHFDVEHSTLQFESAAHAAHDHEVHS